MTIQHPNFGRLAANQIIVFDTTLRDGEQSPGFSMTADEKLRMAQALATLGVDVIEAGFPAASPQDAESVRRIAEHVIGPVIAGLARANPGDIEATAAAVGPARRKRIHTFIATSELHIEKKLRSTPENVLETIKGAVTLARNLCDDVEFSCEDASRTDPDYLCRAVEAAIKAGATTINLPDTVGYAMPADYAAMFKTVIERVPGADAVIFSAHCHNDLGMAVANSLAAFAAGARQVEGSINGIGERAGNASIEEIVMAMRTRQDAHPFRVNVDTRQILKTSKLLSAITGFEVQPNKAIVGRNAFAHESGIHQDGMLKSAQTYEIMTPESVGWSKSSLVLGKHSGRAAFKDKLASLGYTDLSQAAIDDAFARFKDLADRKKTIYDEDVEALVDESAAEVQARIKLLNMTVQAGSDGKASAHVELEVDGAIRKAEGHGDGAVHAAFNALRIAFPHDAALNLFAVNAVTEGADAQAKTTVRLEEHGRIVDGQGADTDTIVSAARAYVHALNKLVAKREKAVHISPAFLTA
jgi:2-isopropylmalate synthase